MLYKCKVCKADNLLASEISRSAPFGRCKKCQNKYMKEYNNRPTSLNSYYKKIYGITKEEYDKLAALHLNGCAICKQPCDTGHRLCVDHNHKTKEVRGLLCKKCNSAISLLNEDEDLFINAIEYLKRTTWGVRKAG